MPFKQLKKSKECLLNPHDFAFSYSTMHGIFATDFWVLVSFAKVTSNPNFQWITTAEVACLLM